MKENISRKYLSSVFAFWKSSFTSTTLSIETSQVKGSCHQLIFRDPSKCNILQTKVVVSDNFDKIQSGVVFSFFFGPYFFRRTMTGESPPGQGQEGIGGNLLYSRAWNENTQKLENLVFDNKPNSGYVSVTPRKRRRRPRPAPLSIAKVSNTQHFHPDQLVLGPKLHIWIN